MTVIDEILALYVRRGTAVYFGEAVSMAEHALQAAYFAQTAAAAPALITAALLHDVGHLVVDVPDDLADWVDDARHEDIGYRWLAGRFPPEVYEPVRLHVPAKRYLCAKNAHYFSRLSAASVVTLKLQGGPMTMAECARFEQEPYYKEAVRIRRWDDQGKIAGLVTPALESYRALLENVAAGACPERRPGDGASGSA
ncbi:MAG TPA: HD domain-containing protein [Steroidobacteraceae bacterium]|nr:HD domain-containing protein [Steroidobacteraceae bacterium]